MRKMELLAVFAAFALASPVVAQGRGRDRDNDRVPPGQRPPAGMCRIWINGVPPGRQPAPTDCATAAANVPANARIIYGDRTNNTYPSSPHSLPGRRVYMPNGQVVTANGQRCVQRVDANGRTWTTCSRNGAYPNGGYYPNGSYGDRYPNGTYGAPGEDGYPNRRYEAGKHKHHDQDEDDDDQGDDRGNRPHHRNHRGHDRGDDGGN